MDYIQNLSIFEDPKYRNTSRFFQSEAPKITIRGQALGTDNPLIIAGPCAVESEEQLMAVAERVKAEGAQLLRGGVFKPRSSPYAFQGLGLEGLELLKKTSERFELPFITEATSVENFDAVEAYADVVQIGARNMYNYELLKRAGRCRKPVVLKRFFSATLAEFLSSAEYIITAGNPQVILCERGIRGFDHLMRNLLDISSVALLKHLTALPVLADPSHGSGHPFLIEPLSKAALAAGADGIMIEVHDAPEKALCDGYQSLNLDQFSQLAAIWRKV